MRQKTFHDFDEFADSIHDVESKMMLRNPERRSWTISGVAIDSIDVQVGQLSSGNIAQGQLRDDGYMFYIPTTEGVEYVANGQRVDINACVVMEPGTEFCISTKEAHDWAAIFVPNRYFERGMPTELSNDSHTRTCRVTVPNSYLANQMRTVVKEIVSSASVADNYESSAAARTAAEAMFNSIDAVADGLPSEAKGEGRPRFSRDEVVRRSMAYIESRRADSSLLVGDLASAVGVSERTLRTVFKEYFGMGPIRYLQLRRLHQIRRALKTAEADEDTVAQILMKHGEWAFSRFANRYRKLYGELPSETLKTERL